MAAQQVSYSATLGKALFTAWNFSSKKAAVLSELAEKKIDEAKKSNAIPRINNLTSRCYLALPRLITPYPFNSVSCIIDFMISETVLQTRFDNAVHSKPIDEIMKLECYEMGYNNFKAGFRAKTLDWRLQIIADRKKATPHDCQLLEKLACALGNICEDPEESDAVLRPHFNTLFQLTKRLCGPQKLIEHTQTSVGRLMTDPSKRRYQNYLLGLVESSARILAASDQAMRFLGRDFRRAGLDKLYNTTPDAVKMVSVHATLREVADASLIKIFGEVREIKLKCARDFLKSQDTLTETLRILAILEKRCKKEKLVIHVDELSDHLYGDDGILQMDFFDVCTPAKPTNSISLFQQAFTYGLPPE